MATITINGSMTLGELLALYRHTADLDQTEMGRRLGASRPTVSYWERDMREPSFTQVVAWARITGQPLEPLVEAAAEKLTNYRSEGWEFESLRARDCVETVDAQFWRIIGRQGFPDALFAYSAGVAS